MQPSDFEIVTVAELIVTADRLKKCRTALEEIAKGIKSCTFDIDCVSVIIDNTLDWLVKDECEKGVV